VFSYFIIPSHAGPLFYIGQLLQTEILGKVVATFKISTHSCLANIPHTGFITFVSLGLHYGNYPEENSYKGDGLVLLVEAVR
jgi:hypothetical protein